MILPFLLALAVDTAAARPTAADTVIVLGDSPTVVAFLGAEMGEIMFSADWAKIFGGFKPQLDLARPRLEQLSVVVREVYSPGILFRSRGREWPMEPTPASLLVGYYLWSPRGPAYVCAGALSEAALVAAVTEFLERVKAAPSEKELEGCRLSSASGL